MPTVPIKDKAYYKKKYEDFWEACLRQGRKELNKD